jgi:predicted phosphodiesterase
MKVQVISDIHLEERDTIPDIKPHADVLFLAGDIGVLGSNLFEEFIGYVDKNWSTVFYVLGNHELYSDIKCIEQLIKEYEEFFKKYDNIVFLDHDKCQFAGYKIIGCTFWGRFENEKHISGSPHKIKVKNNGELQEIGPEILTDLHSFSYAWVKANIHPVLPTIVLTHFPVTLENDKVRQIKYREEDIETLKEYGAEMNLSSDNKIICISGHTHFSHDFTRNGVRYISNQLGYKEEEEEDICNYHDKIYIL